MGQRPNLTPLDAHALDEQNARIEGDELARKESRYVRRYVAAGEIMIVPSRWAILVPGLFDIDEGGELELDVDAFMEII